MDYLHHIDDQPGPPSTDWIDWHPDCPRAISRIVDLELNFSELLADLLRKQENG